MKDSTQLAIIAAGLGVVALVVYKGVSKVGAVATDMATAINPFNQSNIFAASVDKVGQTVADDPAWSLGGWLFDTFDPRAKAVDESLAYTPAPVPPPMSMGDFARYDRALYEQQQNAGGASGGW